MGHYFATPRNRFWLALNQSGLVPPGETFGPQDDHRLLQYSIGLTDVVKRPTRGAAELRVEDFRRWAPVLREKLVRCRPRVSNFHGVTAYRNFLRYAEGADFRPKLGQQPRAIGGVQVFVTPNPSPANAAYSLETLIHWYRQLAGLVKNLKGEHG